MGTKPINLRTRRLDLVPSQMAAAHATIGSLKGHAALMRDKPAGEYPEAFARACLDALKLAHMLAAELEQLAIAAGVPPAMIAEESP